MRSGAPVDPSLLFTFLAVNDAGRVSAAARALHLSQPAVTAQIRKLEESLGASLFVRSAQGVTPTDAGRRLVGHARTLRRVLEDAARDVAGDDEPVGDLVIAASTTIAAHVLPPLLAEYRARTPSSRMSLHVGTTDEVVDEVRRGLAPLGLVEGHARAPGVSLVPFVDDEIVPVVGTDAAFRLRKVADFAQVPLLWREAGSGTRAVVERALSKAGVRRRGDRDIELGTTEAILGGVIANLGVGFVSRWSMRAHVAAGLVRVPPGLDFVVRRTFRWALPPGALRGAAARFHALAERASPASP